MAKKRTRPEKGYIYVMDFGWLNDHEKILKMGQSIHPEKRLHEHQEKGNQFLKGRRGEVVLAVKVSYYNQDRYEDKTRDLWDESIGIERAFGCKDTFIVNTDLVQEVFIPIKKTYSVRIA